MKLLICWEEKIEAEKIQLINKEEEATRAGLQSEESNGGAPPLHLNWKPSHSSVIGFSDEARWFFGFFPIMSR